MKAILAKVLAVLVFVLGKVKRVVPEVVKEVEKAARDGKITKSERKKVAMKAVTLVAAEFGVKMSFVVRMIVGRLVDKAAKKLPQSTIIVPDIIANICKDRVKSRS